MSYEIKEEGYECRGFKLGQMTNYGKIIGFDIKNVDIFVVTDSTIDKHNIPLSESSYVSVILKGYEDSDFSWFSGRELHWKTSEIARDPVLGDKNFFYLTTHTKGYPEMWDRLRFCVAHLEAMSVPIIREKIEMIIHDTKVKI